MSPTSKESARAVRHRRIRVAVRGTSLRPRLAVFRSHKHIYAQLVDDESGRTLAAASSLSPEFKARLAGGGNIAAAKVVGEIVAEKARARGIERVVFDRGGYRYHGRVKALADTARQGGLVF